MSTSLGRPYSHFGVKAVQRRFIPFNRLTTVPAMTRTVKNPTYADAVERLNSTQSGFAALEARRKAGKKLDASAKQQMQQWLWRIGYKTTDLDALNIVHVAGTKGKGTTCAFINSMLSSCKNSIGKPKKIGLYTSPHLVSVRERIRVNSEPITEAQFTKYFFEVWDALEHAAKQAGKDLTVKPVYFRFLTLLSFHVFMREQVDTAIYEVGVGGELDSTNIVVHPAVTGISTLGIDHVESLGDTIDKIAWHKAGIFKTGSPAFSVHQWKDAESVLIDRALEKNVSLEWVDISPAVRQVNLSPAEEFQFSNASLAVRLTMELLKRLNIKVGERSATTSSEEHSEAVHVLKTTSMAEKLPEVFIKGLEGVFWRARCEEKIVGRLRYFLDGAHTVDSLEIASGWFGRKASTRKSTKILVFNQQSLRDAAGLMKTVFNALKNDWGIKFDHVIFCTNITYMGGKWKLGLVNNNADPAALKTLSLQNLLRGEWLKLDPTADARAVATVEDASNVIRNFSEENGETDVFVTGSFHLVGGMLSILEGNDYYGLKSTISFPTSG